MQDGNSAAELAHSIKVIGRGDYGYSEMLEEAKSYVTERLYAGELTDMLDEISVDAEDYTDWLKLVGGALVSPRSDDNFFVSQFSNIYLSRFSEIIIDRLDKERGL